MTITVDRFRHEALFYAGHESFVAGCVPFIEGGLAAGEPVLVVESSERIELLKSGLGRDAARVSWANMNEVGANPARIIPAWQEFVAAHSAAGQRLRGIGEPIWAARSPDELAECQRHEALLNVAFGNGRAWWLLCPYDTESLDGAILDEARRSHEFVMQPSGASAASDSFRGQDLSGAPFDAALPEPELVRTVMHFDRDSLLRVRGEVARQALSVGLGADRATNLVTAVNEVATNSILHGAGQGQLRIWREERAMVCEIRDRGVYRLPLADRTKPSSALSEPRGLWLANQMCDLVQIRSVPDGTIVRLHMRYSS